MVVKYGPYPWYFIWSFLLGVGLAVFYDLLRLSRRIIKTSDFVVNIEDIIFLMLSGIGISYVSYLTNDGTFRFYAMFGMIFGFVVYRLIFEVHIVNVLERILKAAEKLLGVAIRLISMPLCFVLCKTVKPLFVNFVALNGKIRRKISLKFTKE